MQAHPAGEHEAAAGIQHGQSGMPTALLGMLLFIASEVMFFGGLFATYFNARATTPGTWGPPEGAHELDIALWGLGVDQHPSLTVAAGGKYFFDDDQQWPDTAQVTLGS